MIFFASYLDNRMESFVCEYDLHLAVFLNSRVIPSEQRNYIVKILFCIFPEPIRISFELMCSGIALPERRNEKVRSLEWESNL